MYNSYTSLQREQLAKQTYTDTQSTYLLVYAPLRSRVLAQALQDQLHRKFRLVDHLAGELTDTMQMCGAHTLAEITPDMVRV